MASIDRSLKKVTVAHTLTNCAQAFSSTALIITVRKYHLDVVLNTENIHFELQINMESPPEPSVVWRDCVERSTEAQHELSQ